MAKEKIIGIYKITSPSGKIYIGQSLDIHYRWNVQYFKLKCKSQTKLYESFLEHGVENHTFEIIHTLESFDSNKLELFSSVITDINSEIENLAEKIGEIEGCDTFEIDEQMDKIEYMIDEENYHYDVVLNDGLQSILYGISLKLESFECETSLNQDSSFNPIDNLIDKFLIQEYGWQRQRLLCYLLGEVS